MVKNRLEILVYQKSGLILKLKKKKNEADVV